MTRPYSEDLRERALMMADAGQTIRAIGAALQINPSCVSKWRKLKRDTGGLKPGKIGGHKPRVLTGKWAAWLRRRVLSGRRCTLRGLAAELAARGVKTESRAIWEFLHAEGLSFKKKLRAAEQNRPDIARKRAHWLALQGRIDPQRLVFIDETWVKTNMAPLRGWGLRGRRLETHVPQGHWVTLTFVAALRCDRITAPCVFDGPINGLSFLAKSWCRPSSRATSSSWTISAAAKAKLCGERSARSAPSSSSCPHAVPISIQSSRSSQS